MGKYLIISWHFCLGNGSKQLDGKGRNFVLPHNLTVLGYVGLLVFTIKSNSYKKFFNIQPTRYHAFFFDCSFHT